jgi:hypothetical protein
MTENHEWMMNKLRTYKGPFSVWRFVDKFYVLDANGSECKEISHVVECALNHCYAEAQKADHGVKQVAEEPTNGFLKMSEGLFLLYMLLSGILGIIIHACITGTLFAR